MKYWSIDTPNKSSCFTNVSNWSNEIEKSNINVNIIEESSFSNVNNNKW